MTENIVEAVVESHEEARERAFVAGKAAATFAAIYGADESPEQMAMRRKQDERNPSIWSDAFLAGFSAYIHPAEGWML